ncbi:MAG: ornithine carbamoyltransferase [Kiritimatiellaeota bacterium]|nr:ornithine carbamoyltransferase [Kiritimatiellota bacterium]
MQYSSSLKNRSLLTLNDFTDAEMLGIIDLAIALKARRDGGVRGDLLLRKNIALIFEKGSTRTRCAAAIAAREEGGNVEYLTRADTHFGVKESIKDTARVLGRMFDGILFRGFAQKTVEDLSRYSGVPVWNGLTDIAHPTQILADLMTMKQNFGEIRGRKLVYIGDGRNNVANSLMLGCAKAGVNYVNCTPAALLPDAALVANARTIAERNGSTVEIATDPASAVKRANALYTDVWVSMGEEAKKAERVALLTPYQVNMELAERTGNLGGELIFLHCLPAFHDNETEASRETGAMEVTDDVFEAPFSKVFDEAENRMHTIKALFVSALAETN